MVRQKGTRKPCDKRQAKQRLVDAQRFLEAAEILEDPDVVGTNAIHAAIAAADALTCSALGEQSADGNHQSAVQLLGQCDARLARLLERALSFKSQAGYLSEDIRAADATSCIRWAKEILQAAQNHLDPAGET